MVSKISSAMGRAGYNPIVYPNFSVAFLVWQVLL